MSGAPNDGQAAAHASAASLAPPAAPLVAPAAAGPAMVLIAAEQLAQQNESMAKLLFLTEGNLRVQAQKDIEAAERDVKAARAAEADKAEAARMARQESSSNALKMLKNQASKDKLGWLIAISSLDNPNDRMLLTGAVIEATQMMEDGAEERDDANAAIETAMKKTTLSKEKQEDLLKTIKIRKRAAMTSSAAGGGGGGGGGYGAHCNRCGRSGHVTNDCAARTHISGGPCTTEASLEAVAKYQRTKTGSAYAGPRESYAAAAVSGAGAFFPPPQQYQPAAMQPYGGGGGGGGGYGAAPGVCRKCGVQGHYERACPMWNRAPLQAPAAQQQSGAAVSAAREEAGTNAHARTTTHYTDTHDTAMIDLHVDRLQDRDRSEHTRTSNTTVTHHCTITPTNEFESDSQQHPPRPSTPSRDDESLASLYAERDVPTLDTEQKESDTHNQHPAIDHAADNTHTETDSPSNPNSQAAQLIASLQLTGMPDRDISLRRAILKHFAGKKKMLHEQTIAGQKCQRCGKTGHTQGGCPDQTQRAADDKTTADRWVRNLLELPRVRIAEVNKGLTLEEGVRQWLERGKVANERNPWADSQKREDTLRKQLGYHHAMGMSAVHLGWIGFGVPLNFIEGKKPEPLAFHNHRSALEEADFVDSEHEAGLREGSFVEVRRDQLLGICPLQVEKNPTSGKRRLCQDARWINGHLPNVEFRMESLNVELGDVVQPGDKAFTTDVDKAYYCVALHPDAQPYLGWSWRGKFYMPTCLIFGLSTAPRIFTKLMRPMMAFMRSLHVRVLGMIDDYMWADQPNRIGAVREAVRVVLPQLGWRLNAKCVWEPADEVLMLGMLINTKEFVVKAPAKKINTTLSAISLLLQDARDTRQPSMKQLQRVTGLLMSMMLALPAVRVFTRVLYRCIAVTQEQIETAKMRGQRYSTSVSLTAEAIEELEFWLRRLKTHNSLAISSRENQVEVLLWSDASDAGWGGEALGVTMMGSEKKYPRQETAVEGMVHGALPISEIQHSSTRRELIGLLQLAQTPAILRAITGKRVKVLMDSIPALRNLINGGGPVENLTQAVKEWTTLCEQYRIQPVYDWIPRAENWRADKASKLHHQQHTFRSSAVEERIRTDLTALTAGRSRRQHNHWLGRVPIFTPMFHQVDARVEMIRTQLEEAIIVVPEWPAGGTHDWFRRVEQNSIARMEVGKAREIYAEGTRTGHSEVLIAFWLMGRRGQKKACAASASGC